MESPAPAPSPHRLLDELREQRRAETRMDSLRRRWSTPLWCLLPYGLLIVSLYTWHFLDDRFVLPRSTVEVLLFFLAASVFVAINAFRARERPWREVVRREAPSLHAKLTHLGF